MMVQIEKRKKGRPSKADQEERRREKKIKVTLTRGTRAVAARRVAYAPPPESEDDDLDDEIEEYSSAEASVRERKAGSNDDDSIPGTPPDLPAGVSLPERKTLELVLDKLQKKDTYGVFAEPVDPDELPDYHDVIEQPMDFATVRKKLGKGSYSTLKQFEAFSIQELAKRKFQRLRSGAEQYDKELQSEQKPTSNSLGTDKQIKKPIAPSAPQTVASDLAQGATLATTEDLQPGSTTKASAFDRLSNVDESVDGTATQSDNNLDKVEDLPSGRGHIFRFGRKPLLHDDNRRATYSISTQPVCRAESVLSTFDDETKQLVSVGLHADHSYARSLARFAAMLGPVAWNVASKRIEQALPPGFKFGRGWVGDYEPISKPVLVMQKCSEKESVFHKELNVSSNPNKDKNFFKTAKSRHKNSVGAPTSDRKPTLFGASVNTTVSPRSYSVPSEPQPLHGEMLDVKPNIAASVSYQVQSPRGKNIPPEKKVKKRVQLNSPPSPAVQSLHEISSTKQISNETDMPGSKSMEPQSRDINHLVSVPFKSPQNVFVERTNGKSPSNNFDIHRTTTPVNTDGYHTSMPANYFPHGHDQALTDPVQLMRTLSENAQKQQKSTNHFTSDNPLVKKEDPSNASSAAARAWMSIGSGSSKTASENTNVNNKNQIFVNTLHSPTQLSRFRSDFPVPGMQFHPMNNNNFPIQGFMAPQFQTGNDAHYQNRPHMVFPQLVTSDLSRFQMQPSPRQGQHLLQRQPSQKQETTIPPDLNLVFQSSGSPGKSSGLQVDSQQPDLALQL